MSPHDSLRESFPKRLFFTGFTCATFLIIGVLSLLFELEGTKGVMQSILGCLLIFGSALMGWVGYFITKTEYRL